MDTIIRSTGRTAAPALLGSLALLAVWELVGVNGWLGSTWPPFSSIVDFVADPVRSRLLWRSLPSTLRAAAAGFVFGAIVGALIAIFRHLSGVVGRGLERLLVSINAVPLIAFGPMLITTVGATYTPIVSASIAAFFPVFVASTSGLNNVPRSYLDLAQVTGARPARRLRRAELPHALPALIDGLRLAAPAALIGAIIGEWFGASRGLGVVILSSMQNFQIEQLWAAALVGTVSSISAYLVLTVAHGAARRRYEW